MCIGLWPVISTGPKIYCRWGHQSVEPTDWFEKHGKRVILQCQCVFVNSVCIQIYIPSHRHISLPPEYTQYGFIQSHLRTFKIIFLLQQYYLIRSLWQSYLRPECPVPNIRSGFYSSWGFLKIPMFNMYKGCSRNLNKAQGVLTFAKIIRGGLRPRQHRHMHKAPASRGPSPHKMK